VAEVEAEDLQSIPPLGEVRLARVARRRIPGEPGRHDEPGAAPEELEARLIADLDPAAGQQRHGAPQIGELGALDEVELGAGRAELVVEVVQRGEVRLAHVAMLPLERLARGVRGLPVGRGERLGRQRREDVGRGDVRAPPQGADAGAVADRLLALDLVGFAAAGGGAYELAAARGVGSVDVARCLKQAGAILGRNAGEQGAVGDESLEQADGGAKLGEENGVSCRGGHARI
jgi:hypothetical protein